MRVAEGCARQEEGPLGAGGAEDRGDDVRVRLEVVIERDRDRERFASPPSACCVQELARRDGAVVSSQMPHLRGEESGSHGWNELVPRVARRIFDSVIDEGNSQAPG